MNSDYCNYLLKFLLQLKNTTWKDGKTLNTPPVERACVALDIAPVPIVHVTDCTQDKALLDLRFSRDVTWDADPKLKFGGSWGCLE